MTTTVFHFTARRFVDGIQRDGLSKGVLVINDRPIQLDHGYRWLTTSDDWNQEWAEGTGRLPYRRNEARLTFDIPDSEAHRLLRWTAVGPLVCRIYDVLSGLGDHENWLLWHGDVPASWIVSVAQNPKVFAGTTP